MKKLLESQYFLGRLEDIKTTSLIISILCVVGFAVTFVGNAIERNDFWYNWLFFFLKLGGFSSLVFCLTPSVNDEDVRSYSKRLQ